ncbi:MAG: Maf family protein [bacterium]|nr:Maf family protein [bacterium]
MQKIILASSSPRRKELLEQAGIIFTVEHSDYEEDLDLKMRPRTLAKYLALGKARAIASRHKEGIVIGADTIVVCDGRVIGKPVDARDARVILALLSGRGHEVITGFAIVDSKTKSFITRSVVTKVWFRKLASQEIDEYVKTGEPLEAAGAYRIQKGGARFVKRIEGDFSNIVGLHVKNLIRELGRFNVKVMHTPPKKRY